MVKCLCWHPKRLKLQPQLGTGKVRRVSPVPESWEISSRRHHCGQERPVKYFSLKDCNRDVFPLPHRESTEVCQPEDRCRSPCAGTKFFQISLHSKTKSVSKPSLRTLQGKVPYFRHTGWDVLRMPSSERLKLQPQLGTEKVRRVSTVPES